MSGTRTTCSRRSRCPGSGAWRTPATWSAACPARPSSRRSTGSRGPGHKYKLWGELSSYQVMRKQKLVAAVLKHKTVCRQPGKVVKYIGSRVLQFKYWYKSVYKYWIQNQLLVETLVLSHWIRCIHLKLGLIPTKHLQLGSNCEDLCVAVYIDVYRWQNWRTLVGRH